MITAEDVEKLDDRTLRWYRKHITQFHQECLQFDRCYGGGERKTIFHEHFKELEHLLHAEIVRRNQRLMLERKS